MGIAVESIEQVPAMLGFVLRFSGLEAFSEIAPEAKETGTPKEFRLRAQGCRLAATLGRAMSFNATLKGVRQLHWCIISLRHWRQTVAWVFVPGGRTLSG